MKITFDDKSCLEIKKSNEGGIIIFIQAKDATNSLKKITNSVEISLEQWKSLITDIQ